MKELEDYKQFPSFIRNIQTEFIGFVVTAFPVYKPFISYLKSKPAAYPQMFDLCSGSGQPAVSIFKESGTFGKLTLSDKFPPAKFIAEETIEYLPVSMDASRLQFKPGICYTMFNAFHHFSDSEKHDLLKRCRKAGAVIFIVEILRPNATCFLKVLFATVLGVPLLTPFIRPFSFNRIIFTYLIPLSWLSIIYDGIISVIKSRSPLQYQKILADEIRHFEIQTNGSVIAPLLIINSKSSE